MADRRSVVRIAIAVLAGLALLAGWRAFCFMTDDAFIAFRYISNSVAGHGWVWNAAPFRAVDGYTSWAWIVLLEAIWRITGIDPPRAANPVALAFAFGQLALCLDMLWRVRLTPALERVRPTLVVLALAGVLGNRTFLAWTSSGLETSMFDFEILLWVWIAMWRRDDSPRWSIELVLAAVLLLLTRPDGLLYVAATVVMLAGTIRTLDAGMRRRTGLVAGAGALTLLAYTVWHHHSYGAFFPNTFYAKVARHWPEAGVRYLASFVLEYALLWWIAVMLLLGVTRVPSLLAWRPAAPALVRAVVRCVAPATVIAHAAYYTFVVGGDHFEYRVYVPLVPLAFISFVWAMGMLRWSAARATVVLALFVMCSWVIPGTHWLATRGLRTRAETAALVFPVAPALPGVLRWYAEPFDELQQWLIARMICVRHQEHAMFYESKIAGMPPREDGERITGDALPVAAAGEAGYIAWVLPNVAIIDTFGLNDYYVARNTEHTSQRMAHSRAPPPGYVEAFAANMYIEDGSWKELPRKQPLTGDDIVAIERRFDAWLANLR
jgi:arabinofuranosyltransferase